MEDAGLLFELLSGQADPLRLPIVDYNAALGNFQEPEAFEDTNGPAEVDDVEELAEVDDRKVLADTDDVTEPTDVDDVEEPTEAANDEIKEEIVIYQDPEQADYSGK